MKTNLSAQESTAHVIADLAWIAAGTLCCAWLAIHYEWTERLFAWTRNSESFQTDELAFVLLSLAIGFAWFSARRWRGTRRELKAKLLLQSELAQTLDEQRRLARQFADVQEHERKRLSRELHDELGQFINAIKLDAVAIRAAAANLPPHSALVERANAIIANTDLVHESVARLIRELRPVGLDELGLAAAIEHCVDTWRARLEPAHLALTLDEHIDRLDEARTLAVYRTVQEALNNCARHAHAHRVSVRVEWAEDDARPASAVIRVEDDGVGTDLRAKPAGLGLIGMRERLSALGGSVSFESAPQAGFRLLAQVPADSAVPAAT